MPRLQIEGAKFELGLCFVEFRATIGPEIDLATILARHARQEYEPGMLVEHWGGRITSTWNGGDVVIGVETVTFSAEGWQGPLTHVETGSWERYREHVAELERGWVAPLNNALTRVGAGYHIA